MSSISAIPTIEHKDRVDILYSDTLNIYNTDLDTSEIDEHVLMRKIDWHLIPWLSLLYLLSFMDRANIGNAKLYHLEDDLHITDRQYLIALTVLFFPFALFEPLSNIAVSMARPSIWFSFILVIWGVTMTMHGFIHDYGGLVGLRILLGASEAGLYPGVVFYLSCWYKRSELGTRVAVFFSAATVAGAFSGLLAAAISNMDGIAGKPAWAWIFILEGTLTIICAIASFWIIQDYPETARFLSETERVWVIHRLRADMQPSPSAETFRLKYIFQCLKDSKTYMAMCLQAGVAGPLYAFSLFTPTILNQLGFEATPANLLSVPVYVWACILTIMLGIVGDRYGHRGYINLALFSAGFLGYIILIVSRNAALSYFAIYLAASAIYASNPNSAVWISNNVEGSHKRSILLGMMPGFGGLQGAITSNVYRNGDKPWYTLGHGIVLVYILVGWLTSVVLILYFRRMNASRIAGKRDEVIEGVDNECANAINGCFSSVEAARAEKGDMWSGFVYTM